MTPYYRNTFFKITTKALYEKTLFDYEKLTEELSPSNVFNFFVTAYHLKDYVKAEYNLNESADIRAFSSDMNDLLDLAGFIALEQYQLGQTPKEQGGTGVPISRADADKLAANMVQAMGLDIEKPICREVSISAPVKGR